MGTPLEVAHEEGSAPSGLPIKPVNKSVNKPIRGVKTWVWLISGVVLSSTAWWLYSLANDGTYVFVAPAINSATIAMTLWLLAAGSVLAGISGLLRGLLVRFKNRAIRVTVTVLAWLVGAGVTLALFFYALMSLLASPGGDYTLESPDGERSVLILNRSFLLVGMFPIYEAGPWPMYEQLDWITTDDGYDPFRAGEYQASWTAEGLELRYASQSGYENAVASGAESDFAWASTYLPITASSK